MPFGAVLAELSSSGWIHAVAFSPSGCRLAFVSHDSTVAVVDANHSCQDAIVVRTPHLPFTSLIWVTENSVVVAVRDMPR
jgi:actin related protein 2/3 complex subunit 1A/1B